MTELGGLDKSKTGISDEEIKKILQYIESVHYGSVTIVVQGGKIVQIEKNEKIKIK
jgi:hypothetical protein